MAKVVGKAGATLADIMCKEAAAPLLEIARSCRVTVHAVAGPDGYWHVFTRPRTALDCCELPEEGEDDGQAVR